MKSLLLALALTTAAVSGAPRPFFVFDNGLDRANPPGFAARFELVKQTGFDGLSWRTDTPERIRELIEGTRANGLKTFAVYIPAHPPGPLTGILPKLGDFPPVAALFQQPLDGASWPRRRFV